VCGDHRVSPRSASTLPFPARPRGFSRSPSPAAFTAGSSSRAVSLLSRVSRSVVALGLSAPGTSHGVPCLLRDISQQSPRSRTSQARFVPSSTFRTSSTACSSARLAGLFHPAATSEVRSPGVFPSTRPCRLVTCLCPPVVDPSPLPANERWRQENEPAFRALLRAGVRRRSRLFRPRTTRSPPELSLPRVLLRTPWKRFRAPSAHGLSRPSACRQRATWPTLATEPAPFEVLGLPFCRRSDSS
jgi:hypothetical protein